jgi:hypothetical protein
MKWIIPPQKIASLLVVAAFAGMCVAQTSLKKIYPNFAALAITPVNDGNFIVAGGNILADSMVHGFALKINQFGDTLWTKACGRCICRAIAPDNKGNCMIVGVNLILKIGPNGDILLEKQVLQNLYAITATRDGNFIAAGFASDYSALLMKIDGNGETVWEKHYKGNNSHLYLWSVCPAQDSNVIAVGSDLLMSGDSLNPVVKEDFYLLAIKPDGDTIWTKKISSMAGTLCEAKSIMPTTDKCFVAAGMVNTPYNGTLKCLIKFNQEGDTLWSRIFDNGNLNCVSSTQDGNIFAAGISFPGELYASSVKLGQNGDELWQRNLGKGEIYAMAKNKNNDFIVVYNTDQTLHSDIIITTVIDDKYIRQDSLFTLKIPTGNDSLKYRYVLKNGPSDMGISSGGTITWRPGSDSVYIVHINVSINDEFGLNDTCVFNLFVNCPVKLHENGKPIVRSFQKGELIRVAATSSPPYISFSVPISTGTLCMYDMKGRCIEKRTIAKGMAFLNTRLPASVYFASVTDGTRKYFTSFVYSK